MADICILQIAAGEIRMECVASLLNAARSTEPRCDILLRPAGPYLDAERNTLWAIALEASDAPWFLWIDSDTGFTMADVVNVTDSTDHPVTAGWYCSALAPAGVVSPVLYDWREGNFVPIDPTALYAAAGHKTKAGQRIAVDACGAGFLAVHRSVAQLMLDTYKAPMPWFDEPLMCGRKMGEDFGFCLRLRQLGIPVWVRPDVHLDHYKTMKL